MEAKINDYLLNIGCCWRCILIFLGHSSVNNFLDDKKFASLSLDLDDKDEISEIEEGKTNENGIDLPLVQESKKLKTSVCLSCLGILQNCDSRSTIQSVSDAIQKGDFDAKKFSLSISLPICLPFRIHLIWAYLVNNFPSVNTQPARTNHIGVMKDIWRSIVGPKVAADVGKEFLSGQFDCFTVNILTDFVNNDEECLLLEKLDPIKFQLRRKQCRKYAEGLYTNQVVREIISGCTDQQILEMCPSLPPVPSQQASFKKCQCVHTSLYLAGRYGKYSRTLPQTPWFVSEDRRFDSSVQELISEPLNMIIKADGIKFSSSGREDVDVRCLGRGRPFVMEFLNPRRVEISNKDLVMLQERVNTSSRDVQINDLQVIDKKDTINLKEGEDEKTKSYCALCFSKELVPLNKLEDLVLIKDLTLNQMTPLRVLHRRPLSVRQRVVHTARAQRIDDHYFKLYVNTQAGTYIKEFVHGDFGRTTPNLGSILGVKCDILALDVENVMLDWPPPRNKTTIL